MFGMGFMEIFLVLIVAVMALGPDKLPSAAVDMVKFFKRFKTTINDAKTTLDNELNISEMKNEAEKFKSSINDIKDTASFDINDVSAFQDEEEKIVTQKKEKAEIKKVDIVKKSDSKKENISFDNKKEEQV